MGRLDAPKGKWVGEPEYLACSEEVVDQLVMWVVDDKEEKLVDKVIKSLKTVYETFFFSSSFLSMSRLISPYYHQLFLGV